MRETLEWVEKAALENLRAHLQATDALSKEASTTLTVLFAALGGAFAYALKGNEHAWLAAILTAYLSFLSLVLVWYCMRVVEAPAPTNEPRNLLQEGYAFDALRRAELKNIQQRIDQAAHRNELTALWLNRVRVGAASAPVIAVLATFVAARVLPAA